MTSAKIIEIDSDHVGVILPPDVLQRLGVKEGDALFLSNTPDGFRLSVGERSDDADQ